VQRPTDQPRIEPVQLSARSRTVSPSLHPCSASGKAWGFLQASALVLHETLRTPGARYARCVRPTSATRTKTMTRAVVRSRLLEPLSRSGTPVTIRGRHAHDRGTGCFHDTRTASDPRYERATSWRWPRGRDSRARAYSTRDVRCDEPSDTPVANPSSFSRSRTFVRASHACRRGAEHVGRKTERLAKVTVAEGP